MFSSQAFLSLARFADNQYQVIVDYMKSSTFENKQNLMKKAKVRHGGGGGARCGQGIWIFSETTETYPGIGAAKFCKAN